MLSSPTNDIEWRQAKLSVSNGGLGLRSCERHSGVAYIGSLNLSMEVFSQIRGSGEDIEWAPRYSIERGAVSARVGVMGPG